MKPLRALFEKILLSPLNPFLFASYFILRLYAVNIAQVTPLYLARPLFISILGAAAIYGIFYFIIRKKHMSAFMASAAVVMFYLFAEAARLIFGIVGIFKGLHAVWALLTALIVWLIARSRNTSMNRDSVAAVNLMAFILILFPALQIIVYMWVLNIKTFTPPDIDLPDLAANETPPDIYYIILDMYPRADVLKTDGYDNSGFIAELEGMGFYVAECSQSNYEHTSISISSSLNLNYIQSLNPDIPPESVDLIPFFQMLEHNAARSELGAKGYKIAAFASGFPWAEWRDADLYTAPPRGPVTEFETIAALSSYARTFDDFGILDFSDLYNEQYRARTRLVLSSFDMLAREPGPKFVFIHLIVPHAPYVFDENGNPADPKTQSYISQVMFINKALPPLLKMLIEDSPLPPVILLQGDHGPLGDEFRLKILNAYYLPDSSDQLYPEISPVNSFRVVFNSVFNANLPLLEDVSYFSRETASNFVETPNTCPPDRE